MHQPARPQNAWRWTAIAGGVLTLVVAGYLLLPRPSGSPSARPPQTVRDEPSVTASPELVHQFCSACHAYPPPNVFPRAAWKKEIDQAYAFFETVGLRLNAPPMTSLLRYYESLAPEELLVQRREPAPTPAPVRFTRTGFGLPDQPSPPGVTNVRFAYLFDSHKLDIVVCDMRSGLVMALRPYEPSARLEVLAHVPHPAHAEVLDLDGDGIQDILVAVLGSFEPTDLLVGSVVWLRGTADGKFEPITLAAGYGRIADVQAADFDGDGDLDLVVAEFGWRNVGEVLYLENRTADYSRPDFVPHVLDRRHGAIHVPVADLNGDGRADFVALFSQESETAVAFLNEGSGQFTPRTIFTAPHPAFGSSGIQLVDLDVDGDLDVLLTNGDSLDSELLRPYHGIHWLENRGGYPFEPHHLTWFYGVHRALAADMDGDGDLDIVATSLLPAPHYPMRSDLRLDSVLLLEQTEPRQFVCHSLETITCDHATCDVGDFDADGNLDVVVGNLCWPAGGAGVAGGGQSDSRPNQLSAIPARRDWVLIWRNKGRNAGAAK